MSGSKNSTGEQHIRSETIREYRTQGTRQNIRSPQIKCPTVIRSSMATSETTAYSANVISVDLSEIPEPPEPEEILGTKTSTDTAVSQGNPFTGNLWRLPELLQREFTEDWIIDGLFCRGDLVALYGPAKSAKTFLALDMAMSAATGSAWCNGRFSVPKGRTIVYCAGEGIRGLKRRWTSVSDYYSASHEAMSRIITVPLVHQLFEEGVAPGGVSQFIAAIKDGLPDEQVDLIVIDTLNRASVGANENSAQDIGVILAHCTQIQKETGAAVMLVHHADKQGITLRGSSALRAAVDVALKVDPRSGGKFQLICDAIKDGERFDPLSFDLFPIQESVVVNWLANEDEIPGKTHTDRVMDYLGLHPGDWHSSSAIASFTGVQKNRACEALGRLEREGKIESSLTNPMKTQSSHNPRVFRIKRQDGAVDR